MSLRSDVVVVGAGAAGCAAALRLRRQGVATLVVERDLDTPERFCGEFLSGEAEATLAALGVREVIAALDPAPVRRMGLYGGGRCFGMPLSAGGFGLTRLALDGALLAAARDAGAEVAAGLAVDEIEGNAERGFRLRARDRSGTTVFIEAAAVIGAWGKRAAPDRTLGRRFLQRPSPWVGVKVRFQETAPSDEVALFVFPGGHCGLVDVEGRRATWAALARSSRLRAVGGRPERLVEFARRNNPALEERLRGGRLIESAFQTVGAVPLQRKEPTAGGVLLAGDAAGLTAPFLGLGVANALRTGCEAADAATAWLQGRLSPAAAERAYRDWWRRHVAPVQSWSYAASALLGEPAAAAAGLWALRHFPALAEALYRRSRARLPSAA